MSANGGILLVVTGYMTLKQGENNGEQRFVHSFFLSNEKQGAKKHFFVLNDVFRFLTEVENDEDEEEVVLDVVAEEENKEEVLSEKEEVLSEKEVIVEEEKEVNDVVVEK